MDCSQRGNRGTCSRNTSRKDSLLRKKNNKKNRLCLHRRILYWPYAVSQKGLSPKINELAMPISPPKMGLFTPLKKFWNLLNSVNRMR